jgi:hypothetical protein
MRPVRRVAELESLGDFAREHTSHILLPELLRPERLHLFRSASSIGRLAQEDAEASRPD